MKGRAIAERRLAWLLCAPALAAMLLVTAYPILYAVWLSLYRYDLRFPEQSHFIGLANYISVLSSEVWWQALVNTLVITLASVAVELVLGFALALLMFKATIGRRTVRTVILIPYAMITVVSALAWKFAFDPTTGFVNALLNLERAWLTDHWSAFFVIIFSEIWKTTPFMALLLLAGLTLIPQDLIRAARVDGASAWQRLVKITVPLMKPTVLVALLFRTLDAFRIFDTVYVQTRGAADTETVSVVGYNVLIARLNLGLGSAVSVLIFIGVLIIALLFIKGFGASLSQSREE
ncbi:MAG: carbohydrate ABC transporter permease [Gammaproteobacteria bacterium]